MYAQIVSKHICFLAWPCKVRNKKPPRSACIKETRNKTRQNRNIHQLRKLTPHTSYRIWSALSFSSNFAKIWENVIKFYLKIMKTYLKLHFSKFCAKNFETFIFRGPSTEHPPDDLQKLFQIILDPPRNSLRALMCIHLVSSKILSSFCAQ